MTFKPVALACMVLSLSACATVNVTEVETTSKLSTQTQDSVVVKASEDLRATFAQKNWVQTNDFQMKSAAMVMLKGVQIAEVSNADQSYSNSVTQDGLTLDINEATVLARQTLAAAEIYMKYLEPNTDLSADLTSLENALLDCRKAEYVFETTAKTNNWSVKSQLNSMSDVLTDLENATDLYGDYVRYQKKAMSPISATEAIN